MTANGSIGGAGELRQHLALARSRADFDMDDRPELKLLESEELRRSLEWLAESVGTLWRETDRRALRSQTIHRRLARVAISAGTASIVLAIVQLATKTSSVSDTARFLEAIAVTFAVVAVGIGVLARYARRWLGYRHRAERLRMLKFRAFEQLWCLEREAWERWVGDEITALRSADDHLGVERWAREDALAASVPEKACETRDATFARELTDLYRFKRVAYQADYFARRHSAFQHQTRGWRHVSLPLFRASIVCVLLHFGFDEWGKHAQSPEAKVMLEQIGRCFLTFAAVIPVIGAGIRAWFTAFELPRSASLFAAKHRALMGAAKLLERDTGNIAETQHHMAETEHFLEQEHREWLRLLSDAEWFL